MTDDIETENPTDLPDFTDFRITIGLRTGKEIHSDTTNLAENDLTMEDIATVQETLKDFLKQGPDVGGQFNLVRGRVWTAVPLRSIDYIQIVTQVDTQAALYTVVERQFPTHTVIDTAAGLVYGEITPAERRTFIDRIVLALTKDDV